MPQSRIRRYLKHGTLPQLSVFEAVVRLGSFTRAAEELHMAQPTVSVQIKKLTETAGVPLLEQIGKRIHVTEPGRALLTACAEIFQALMKIEDKFASIRALESGGCASPSARPAAILPRACWRRSAIAPRNRRCAADPPAPDAARAPCR